MEEEIKPIMTADQKIMVDYIELKNNVAKFRKFLTLINIPGGLMYDEDLCNSNEAIRITYLVKFNFCRIFDSSVVGIGELPERIDEREL